MPYNSCKSICYFKTISDKYDNISISEVKVFFKEQPCSKSTHYLIVLKDEEELEYI